LIAIFTSLTALDLCPSGRDPCAILPELSETDKFGPAEWVFSEEDQQVAMKRDEPTSLLCSPFIRNSPRLASINVTFP
jgi:hypothetical protein